MIVKNLEKKEHSTATFDVEVEAEAFEKAIDSAYKRAKGSISVAGFRKGKAPRVVVEGLYGAEVFHEDAVQIIAPDAFEFGVEELKLDNVGMPSIVSFNVEADKSAVITFATDVYPEATLGQFKGLEAEYSEDEVSEERVMNELQAARKRAARLVEVERPVQMGDTIEFDFEGFTDGVAFPGGSSKDYTLEIGSGSFIPGFEDQLVGQTLETEGEVNVTFPENYAPELAGKAATFKVLIHSIKEAELPELDDEFAKDVSEYDTLEAYKQSLYDEMKTRAVADAERSFHSVIMAKAIDNMTVEVPEGMIQEKMDDFLRNYAESMGMGGNISRADLLKTIGATEESFKEMIRPTALKQAEADILLDKIIEDEKIEATQEEIDAFWKSVEDDYGDKAEQVKGMINEELMLKDLKRKAAAELLYSTAVKTEPKAEAAEEKTEE